MKKKTIATLLAVLFPALACAAWWVLDAHAQEGRGRARHIILFVGDGMHLEHENAASLYLYGRENALSFHKLEYRGFVATWDVTTYNRYAFAGGLPPYDPKGFIPTIGYDPSQGGFEPYPANRTFIDDAYFLTKLPLSATDVSAKFPATDSASAATAWATGFKTDAGNVAWAAGDPDDGALTTVAELLRSEKGFSIGVVSTVPFSHATPAAHVSHNRHRRNFKQIAREIIRTVQPEVVIGGGYPGSVGGSSAGFQYLGRDDYDFLKRDPASPYVFVERQTGVDGSVSLAAFAGKAAYEGKKLFGLFGGPEGNFESPVAHDFPGTPLVTRATIENPLLKDATLAALKVLSRDQDGFFLMIEQGDIDWANHGNDFRRMIGTLWDLHAAVQGAVDFINQPDNGVDWSNALLIVTSDHANSFMRLRTKLGAGDLPAQEGTCGSGEPPCTYPDGEVFYSSTDHTNELVMLYAQGALQLPEFAKYEGRWYPCTRIIDNTQLYHIMMEAVGTPRPSVTPNVPTCRLSPNDDDATATPVPSR